MKSVCLFMFLVIFQLSVFCNAAYPAKEIPANHPNIQYFGRWDFSDSLAPKHGWPGVYIVAKFEGTGIGVKMKDNYSYYNVFIDNKFSSVFHGSVSGTASYTLAAGLKDTVHVITFMQRNEADWTSLSFNGFILDDGKDLLPPPQRPVRKIEFIGDSYTSASGNEYTLPDAPPEGAASYTNIYEGFGPITARHFDAQYTMSSRSGYGLVMDYLGSVTGNVPDNFDRTLLYWSNPKWDFEKWVPNLVVICLGLNDYSGFGGYSSGGVSAAETELFKTKYHQFITRIRGVYPGVKILAVAAHVEWIQKTVSEIVSDERSQGHGDIFYTYFPYYDGGYVNSGHPTVATHHKIAERLIAAIDTIDAWTPYNDLIAPVFTKVPVSGFTVYDTSYVLKVTTDSYATVRFSTQDQPYGEMESELTTANRLTHSAVISCKENRKYTYYLRASDIFGNTTPASSVVQFTVDTTKILLNWKQSQYNQSNWKTGKALLTTGTGTTQLAKVATAYFRKTFSVDDVKNLTGIGILIKGRSGAVVYLNGDEIQRINMPADSAITYNLVSSGPLELNKMIVINALNYLSKLRNGENIITVEMHSSDPLSPNLAFDSQLYDSNNKIYYKLGSEWNYYDKGNEPGDQLADKTTGVEGEFKNTLPLTTELYNNYPNPFNPSTKISYCIKKAGAVSLKIYNLLGQQIAILVSDIESAGTHSVTFDASKFTSGIYLYELKSGSFLAVKKMILMK